MRLHLPLDGAAARSPSMPVVAAAGHRPRIAAADARPVSRDPAAPGPRAARAGRSCRILSSLATALLATACGPISSLHRSTAPDQPPILRFSGFDWLVRTGSGAPGPNHWVADNVRIDAEGRLHLRIAFRRGRWSGAQVTTRQRLGFGRYTFQLEGRIDHIDPNVVLGLFSYPSHDPDPDGTREIDIEIARWGAEPPAPAGHFAVWPARAGQEPAQHAFPIGLVGEATTHSYVWSPDAVSFRSLHGWGDAGNAIAAWEFRPTDPEEGIAREPMPVHLNLWLHRGNPPADGREVEIVIRSFAFTPFEGGEPPGSVR